MLREIVESRKVSIVDILDYFKRNGWSKGKLKIESLQGLWLPFTPIDEKAEDTDTVATGLSKMGVTYVINGKNYISVKFNMLPEVK